jgi:hypothetical protein
MPIAEFSLEGPDGAKVMVDVDDASNPEEGARGFRGAGGLVKAGQSFEASLASIKSVASKVLSVVKEIGPDEGEVTLGFKLTASSGVILAKMSGEANIGVKLVWKK